MVAVIFCRMRAFSEEIIFPKKGRVHMKVKHISIAVDPEQTGNPVFGAPADLTAYILEPVEGITDEKKDRLSCFVRAAAIINFRDVKINRSL